MRKCIAVGIAIAIGLALSAGQAPADEESKINFKEDVVYGRVQGAGLLADIAWPEGKGPFPALISVHGGRWRAGFRNDASSIKVREWAGFGFFAMTIDYRLVGCTPAPACYQDTLCAIRWVRAHAKEYNIDPDRIFLIGQSAGGQLVSLAATLGTGPFKATGGWEDQSSDFRAAICVAANYELTTLDWGNIWAPPGEDLATAQKLASPLGHVSAKTKPILIIHSDDDKSVPVKQAVEMAEALEKAKVQSRFVHYKDKGHMGITKDVIQETRSFIDEVVKKGSK